MNLFTRGTFIVRPANSDSRLHPRYRFGRVLTSKPEMGKLELEWFFPAGEQDGELVYYSEFQTRPFASIRDWETYRTLDAAENAIKRLEKR
jgi:hypothetical protein